MATPPRSSDAAAMLAAALGYAGRGWAVFPLAGKVPALAKRDGGKGVHDASTDAAVVGKMWSTFPAANVGIACGKYSGIWVLDIDDEAGMASLAELEARHGPLPATVCQVTGGGGRHLLFAYHGEPLKNRAKDIAPGIDVRATGGYIVVAPSVHPDTGALYEWLAGHGPGDMAPADAPPWLIELASKSKHERANAPERDNVVPLPKAGADRRTRYVEKALAEEVANVHAAGWGTQEATLNRAALKIGGYVKSGSIGRERAYQMLVAAGLVMPAQPGRRPWVRDEIERKVAAAFEAATPKAVPEGNAPERQAGGMGPRERASGGAGAASAAARDEAPEPDDAPDWRALLIRSEKGAARSILANAITALRLAPEWSGVIVYNEFTLVPVLRRRPPWARAAGWRERAWTSEDDLRAAEWLQREGIMVGMEIAAQAVETVAREHPVHPVREWLDSLVWDGTIRTQTWLTTYLGVPDTPYARAAGERWLISAVARIYRPGCKADCALILEGEQGIRKSTALRTLAHPWFTDEIADLGSKDASMQTLGVWVIEIAELDSMSRSEAGKIKAFMSRAVDRFRPAYGKRVIEAARQCVFAGTVNEDNYLRDPTGGRRFWPVRCGRIDTEALERDRAQLWAEAVAQYLAGEPWWLEDAAIIEAAGQEQQERYHGDPWDNLIAEFVEDRDFVTTADLLGSALNMPKDRWGQAEMNRVGRCMRTLKWERKRKRLSGGRYEWRYIAPEKPQ